MADFQHQLPPYRWHPTGVHGTFKPRPEVGALIAWERKPWRVVEVREVDPVDWTAIEHTQRKGSYWWRHDPLQWPARPWVLVLEHPTGGARRHLRLRERPQHGWHVLSEHYAVCVHCAELHPCRHITDEVEVAQDARTMDRLTSLTPDHCWACDEVIRPRQRRVEFGGENLLLPGGPTPVRFHTRERCHGTACAYEREWVPQWRGREWQLQCPGAAVHHKDAFVCTWGERCPGERAVHRSWEDHRRGGLRCARCGT